MPSVLVVEDNAALASMAKAILEDILGFTAYVARNGAEAKSLLKDHPQQFTVALVDLNLPDAPNGEIVPVVQSYDIPVIVLTGYFGDELRKNMIELGVVDYVLKKNMSAYEYACHLAQRVHRNYSTKVLIVDDSKSALLMLKRHLEIQRLQVITAENGKDALLKMAVHPDIKLVITDYNMPEMDGFELIQQLRTRHPKDQLAIIGLSSSGEARLSAQLLKSGANDFIGKPFSYEELLCRVNQNLDYLDHIQDIRDAANRDYLTKLHNRRYFFNHGKLLHQKAQFQETPLSLAMIDIDHFKKINDRYGHEAGDTALKHMADLLRGEFPDDLVARFGGEEFCILSTTGSDDTYKRFDEFRRKVADSRIEDDNYQFGFSVSIGISSVQSEKLDASIHAADLNLYRAKEQGRNQVISSCQPES